MDNITCLIAVQFFLCCAVHGPCAAQNEKTQITSADLLNRSRTNSQTGWVLAGMGAGMTTAGVIWSNRQSFWSPDDSPYLLSGFGLLTTLSSIPFFIVSSRQARRAASLRIYPLGFSASIKIRPKRSLQPPPD